MEDFLKKNISIVNKNTLLTIDIGSKINNFMFNKNISKKNLDDFLKVLYKNNLLKKSKISNKILYKYKNTIVEILNNNYTNLFTYDILKYKFIGNNLNVCVVNILNTKNLISQFNYDSIENIESLVLNLNNFGIEIDLQEKYFRFKIIISKPNDFKILFKEINHLIENLLEYEF